MVQPPVPLVPDIKQDFAESYCAFTFATSFDQLERQLHLQPLSVEVCVKEHDKVVGLAMVSPYKFTVLYD